LPGKRPGAIFGFDAAPDSRRGWWRFWI